MTLQQAHDQLRDILEDAYGRDTSIRHDPLYQAVKAWLDETQAVVNAEIDEADAAYYQSCFEAEVARRLEAARIEP